MNDQGSALLALGLIAVVMAVGLAIGYVFVIISSYARGRNDGGYPIFAKFRKRHHLIDGAYKAGMRQGRDKIAKGGYK